MVSAWPPPQRLHESESKVKVLHAQRLAVLRQRKVKAVKASVVDAAAEGKIADPSRSAWTLRISQGMVDVSIDVPKGRYLGERPWAMGASRLSRQRRRTNALAPASGGKWPEGTRPVHVKLELDSQRL